MTLTTVNPALLDTQAQYTGFKNRIINGAMVIDQRNAGASVSTSSGSNVYTLDRWLAQYSQTSKFTIQQSSTAPAGFKNSLKVTSSSAYSVLTGDYFSVAQKIEGYNTADLGFGASGAQTVTVSFWVQSSLTGTFGGALQNSGASRSYPFTYTISAANTWEQKTITVVGDTSGTWLTTNGSGLIVNFGLGVGATYSGTAGAWAATDYESATGAVSVVGTSGATWYVTGVQLEKGSTATSFDYRPYGTELALCQRYYFVATANKSNSSYPSLGSGNLQSSTNARIYVKYPVDMRAAPTAAISGSITISANADYTSTAFIVAYNGISSSMLGFAVTGATAGNGATAYVNGTNNYVDFTAEL